jgi:stage V sporulation protein S
MDSPIDEDLTKQDEPLIKVAPGSPVRDVAHLIATLTTDHQKKSCKVRAIGAGAVNQAVKAVAVARGQVATRGRDLVARPGFETVTRNDGEEASAIVIIVSVI